MTIKWRPHSCRHNERGSECLRSLSSEADSEDAAADWGLPDYLIVLNVFGCVFRKEFVEAYLRYVFSDSVAEQYSAFSSGFLKVCGGEILSLFQPSELMAMVVGNNNYNWEEMEKVSWVQALRVGFDRSRSLVCALSDFLSVQRTLFSHLPANNLDPNHLKPLELFQSPVRPLTLVIFVLRLCVNNCFQLLSPSYFHAISARLTEM